MPSNKKIQLSRTRKFLEEALQQNEGTNQPRGKGGIQQELQPKKQAKRVTQDPSERIANQELEEEDECLGNDVSQGKNQTD